VPNGKVNWICIERTPGFNNRGSNLSNSEMTYPENYIEKLIHIYRLSPTSDMELVSKKLFCLL
jgi:hypothetical protein